MKTICLLIGLIYSSGSAIAQDNDTLISALCYNDFGTGYRFEITHDSCKIFDMKSEKIFAESNISKHPLLSELITLLESDAYAKWDGTCESKIDGHQIFVINSPYNLNRKSHKNYDCSDEMLCNIHQLIYQISGEHEKTKFHMALYGGVDIYGHPMSPCE